MKQNKNKFVGEYFKLKLGNNFCYIYILEKSGNIYRSMSVTTINEETRDYIYDLNTNIAFQDYNSHFEFYMYRYDIFKYCTKLSKKELKWVEALYG